MALKKLSQFITFDWQKFAAGKRFMCTSVADLTDYESKKHIGTKVEAVITEDRTPYQNNSNPSVWQTLSRTAKMFLMGDCS